MCTCTFQEGPVSGHKLKQTKRSSEHVQFIMTCFEWMYRCDAFFKVIAYFHVQYSISLFIALKQMLRSLMHCCCLPQSQVHMIRHYGIAESIWTPKNKDEQGWFLLLMEEILLTS